MEKHSEGPKKTLKAVNIEKMKSTLLEPFPILNLSLISEKYQRLGIQLQLNTEKEGIKLNLDVSPYMSVLNTPKKET